MKNKIFQIVWKNGVILKLPFSKDFLEVAAVRLKLLGFSGVRVSQRSQKITAFKSGLRTYFEMAEDETNMTLPCVWQVEYTSTETGKSFIAVVIAYSRQEASALISIYCKCDIKSIEFLEDAEDVAIIPTILTTLQDEKNKQKRIRKS